MVPPALAAELDVACWYLRDRRAPVSSSQCQGEHFALPELRTAWDAAQGLSQHTLSAGMMERLLAHDAPPTEHGLRLSEANLIESWARRQLVDAAAKLIERVDHDPTVPLSECIDHMREAMGIAEAGQLHPSEPASDVRERFVRGRILQWKQGNRPGSVPIGIPEIQRDIGGFLRGKLSLWIAPTSGHKTTIARIHASHAGEHFPVCYWPLEDSADDIEARSIAAYSHTLTTRHVHADRFPAEEQQMADMIESVDHAPKTLRYGRSGRLTLQRLCSQIRHEATRGLAAAYIDHLHRLKAKNGRRDFDFWGEVGDELADLARELDIAIVAMAQVDKLSQGEASRGEKLPTMSSVRYGGALTDPARSIFMIHRMDTRIKCEPQADQFHDRDAYTKALHTWQAKERGMRVIRIVCEKNTNGPLGDWLFELDPAHDRIVRAI